MLINLTQHDIVIRRPDGTDVVIEPSGVVARVATEEHLVAHAPVPCMGKACHDSCFDVGGFECVGHCHEQANAIPIVKRYMGEATGLPEEGTPCIVSAMVLAAVPHRRGVFAPDTGSTAVRGADGRIVAVTRLVRA